MAVGTYVHRQGAAHAEPTEHLTSWMTDTDFFQVLVVLTAIFFPPLSVFLERGCGSDFLLNFLLSCLGFLPGLAHALWIVYKNEKAIVYNPTSYAPSTLASSRRKRQLTMDQVLRAASDEDRKEKEKIHAEGHAPSRRRDDDGGEKGRGSGRSHRQVTPSTDDDDSGDDDYHQHSR
ncbi:hypothetical protein JCM3770_002873 [Rhodotorula araucariae]